MSTQNRARRFLRGGSLAWGIMTLLAIGIALYASTPYLTLNPAVSRIPINLTVPLHFLILSLHAVAGGLALAIGPFQFLPRFRQRYPQVHRLMGKIYIISVLISSVLAAYSAIVSLDGFTAQAGFIFLALVWFYGIIKAYTAIRSGNVQLHRIWMIRSYALTTAAIVLRVWIGLGAVVLVLTHQMPKQLTTSPLYSTAAWICWTLPLVFAEWFIIQPLVNSSLTVKREKKVMQEVEQPQL